MKNFMYFLFSLVLLFGESYAQTKTSVTIDDIEYYLYTGFTATSGSATNCVYTYDKMVDGDTSNVLSTWHVMDENSYVEFYSDFPIILKGYKFNTWLDFYPTGWTLKAKASEGDEWSVISSYSNQEDYDKIEQIHLITNDNRVSYSFFRFEIVSPYADAWLSEITLLGASASFTYSQKLQKDATCTESGYKQSCFLRNDGKYFADTEWITELTEDEVIDPMKPHTLIRYERNIYEAHWECQVCGKWFYDYDSDTTEIKDHEWIRIRPSIYFSSAARLLVYFNNQYYFPNGSYSDSYKYVGDTVSLYVAEKYIDVSTLKVMAGENSIPLTARGNGVYAFVMPNVDVTVSAERYPEYKTTDIFQLRKTRIFEPYIEWGGIPVDYIEAGKKTTLYIDDNSYYYYLHNTAEKAEAFLVNQSGEIITIPFDEIGSFIYHRDSTVFKIDAVKGWLDFLINETENGKWRVSVQKTEPQIVISDRTYTGDSVTPEPLISAGSLNLTKGSDYDCVYANNVNVGTATVKVTFKGAYASWGALEGSFEITKATPIVSAPTPSELKYVGECVNLINPGSTDFGELLYSISENGVFKSDIPCADGVGDYTVYYRVEESDNWYGIEGSIDVTVENEFKVTFVDADGNEISAADYPYGTLASDIDVPEDQEKAADVQYSYTFAGWVPEIAAVTGNATYTASYDSVLNAYKVTFLDYDGTTLKLQDVNYGDAATAPADPERQGYEFTGWDNEYDNIIANTEVTALYEELSSSSFAVCSSSFEELSSSSEEEKNSSSAALSSSSAESNSKKSNAIVGMVCVPLFSIEIVDRNVLISTVNADVSYAVLDMQGHVLHSGKVNSINVNIAVPNAGSYLVCVGNQVRRVNIK